MKLELSSVKVEQIPEQKSPYPRSPYIAKLEVSSKSNILKHNEVVLLHEFVKEICPQKFAWWVPLPPEMWIDTLIYRAECPTPEQLPQIQAMRIDIHPDKQFSNGLELLLTSAQLITFRKITYRIRSDWKTFALTKVEERGI